MGGIILHNTIMLANSHEKVIFHFTYTIKVIYIWIVSFIVIVQSQFFFRLPCKFSAYEAKRKWHRDALPTAIQTSNIPIDHRKIFFDGTLSGFWFVKRGLKSILVEKKKNCPTLSFMKNQFEVQESVYNRFFFSSMKFDV